MVVQLLPDESRTAAVTLEVRRPARDTALGITGEISLVASKFANIALNLSLLIDALGEWVVNLSLGDAQPSVELPFNVALAPVPE